MCDKNECAVCTGFGEDDCTECFNRTIENEGDCQCDENHVYSLAKHVCTLVCNVACEVCDAETIYTAYKT